jgi:hypothetical protein
MFFNDFRLNILVMKIYDGLFFNFYLRLGIEIYIEIAISCLINLSKVCIHWIIISFF